MTEKHNLGDGLRDDVASPPWNHVAALAEVFQIVGRAVVEVRRGEHGTSGAARNQRYEVGRCGRAAPAIPPGPSGGVEPAPGRPAGGGSRRRAAGRSARTPRRHARTAPVG